MDQQATGGDGDLRKGRCGLRLHLRCETRESRHASVPARPTHIHSRPSLPCHLRRRRPPPPPPSRLRTSLARAVPPPPEGRGCGRRARGARGAWWRWAGWRPGLPIAPRGPRPVVPPGLYLGQCYHKKSSACKCNLGWSSQPSPDVRDYFRGYSSASEAVLTSQSDFRELVGNEKIGVLLLNLGGPETLDDVQPFLFNLFADPDIIRLPRLFRFLQKPLAKFISVVRAPKSKEGYASIGGGSPLRQITDAQAEALREALCEKDVPAKVYVGMRYWHPFTEEAIEQIKRDGITKLVVLPLYPQFSISTSGSSLRLLESIFREDEYLVNMQHTVIPSWYQREGYIKAMATLIEKELTKFPEPQKVMIFFSAHGVPLAYVEEAGDPYKAEMEECIDLIMEELEKRGITNPCTLAYQSRVGPVEWLKPYTDETIIELGQKGVKSLLAVPISFVSEHIETLEEIDVEYKELALESGIKHWGRVPALGCEPTFISDLADAVIESLPYVGAMAVSNLEARQSLVPLGSVEELLAAYDSKRDELPPPVIVWEWGWTKSAETWNGRAAMLAVLALLVLEVTTGEGFLHQWGILH